MTKILLIEDDPSLRSLYEAAFSKAGFEVLSATDGDEGLTKIKTMNPNAVLLDLVIPRMNGFEVLEELKNDSYAKNIPVFIFTSLATDENAEEALQRGATKVISKNDHEPHEVVEMIKNFLSS